MHSKVSCFTKAHEASRGGINLTAVALGLGLWYAATGREANRPAGHVALPDRIAVTDTDLPVQAENQVDPVTGYEIRTSYIDPSTIDFNRDFYLKTERYEVIKDSDDFFTRTIGHLGSCFSKLLFMDAKVGWGLGDEGTREVISMLENNQELNGITVRINHNGIINDAIKLFVDEESTDRNNLLARICIGIPDVVIGAAKCGLSRGDYYNPMTGTAVIYSDVRSIAAHEIGHHKDFRRFNSDWEYSLTRLIPPAMLYQEWQASSNARGIMTQSDQWQFYRYLLPAFATYVLASYGAGRALLRKAAKEKGGNPDNVTAEQVLRHLTTQNAAFMAGVKAYSVMIAAGAPFLLGAAAFGGAAIVSGAAVDFIGKSIVPYEHE